MTEFVGLNIHNTIAMSFLDAMSDNVSNKELLRLFSSVFRLLEISDDISLRSDLKAGLERLEEVLKIMFSFDKS